jgi:hypothetical protein
VRRSLRRPRRCCKRRPTTSPSGNILEARCTASAVGRASFAWALPPTFTRNLHPCLCYFYGAGLLVAWVLTLPPGSCIACCTCVLLRGLECAHTHTPPPHIAAGASSVVSISLLIASAHLSSTESIDLLTDAQVGCGLLATVLAHQRPAPRAPPVLCDVPRASFSAHASPCSTSALCCRPHPVPFPTAGCAFLRLRPCPARLHPPPTGRAPVEVARPQRLPPPARTRTRARNCDRRCSPGSCWAPWCPSCSRA